MVVENVDNARAYARLKTSRGRFPVRGVRLENSAAGLAQVSFDVADDDPAEPAPFDLESLACALPSAGDLSQGEIVERIRDCALVSGPLLGEAAPESLSDWMSEIRIAQAALRIQQAINGDAPIGGASMPVVKSEVTSAETGEHLFTSYCASLGCGLEGDGRLEDAYPAMPWMKRFADAGSCDYAFVCCDATDAWHVLDIHLISFPADVPTVDYSFMVGYFDGLGYDVGGADREGAFANSATTFSGGIASAEREISREDAPHLQHLVHVLVALHTEGVHVDLFKSDGTRDFLAFDSYLSSLWYDFAMRLGTVKVGYCVQCGRGFSLTGHRGMAKEYCSEACRTQAKNERRRAQVARARELFMAGSTVADAAREAYPEMGKRVGEAAVRKALKQWPALKRAVEDDLKGGDGALTKRCVEEDAVDSDWLSRKVRTHAKKRKRASGEIK